MNTQIPIENFTFEKYWRTDSICLADIFDIQDVTNFTELKNGVKLIGWNESKNIEVKMNKKFVIMVKILNGKEIFIDVDKLPKCAIV